MASWAFATQINLKISGLGPISWVEIAGFYSEVFIADEKLIYLDDVLDFTNTVFPVFLGT